jgi:hypothetical protein
MFKIISDSPYGSKRTPVANEQIRTTVRATTVGKKGQGPPSKSSEKGQEKGSK